MSKFVAASLTLGALLIFASLRVVDLWWWRAQTLSAAESRAGNLAVILSEYIRGSFAAGDAALRQLAIHSRRIGGAEAPDTEWLPLLTSARSGLNGVGSFTVTDADGIIRHSTLAQILGQSRREEYVFKRLAAQKDDELVISTPYLSVRAPIQFLLPLGRRLTTPAGDFAGTIVATFSPASQREFIRTIEVGSKGAVWVFHPDGVVLFREPSDANPLGESAKANPIFIAASQGGAGNRLRAAIEPGGAVMINAFQTLTTPPLIVAVSLDQEEVIADWRHQVRGSGLFFTATALTLAATLLVLFRQMDAKAGAERELSQARELDAVRLGEINERLAGALEGERRARVETEAASTLKDEFLMTVSHELRTPLTAIQGWAHILAAGNLDDRRRNVALETIERNARAQTRLVNDLLDVSSAISGKLRLELRPIALAGLVRDAVETIRPAADAKSIAIETSVDAGAVPFVGDAERLTQVIWNLLSNAIKFTSHGGRVAIRVAPAGRDLEIAVSDDGVGIRPEFLPHVFERFRQAEAGTTRRYGGLGLGLAIVRHIVELHGGSVHAESAGENQGATFRVRLPMKPID